MEKNSILTYVFCALVMLLTFQGVSGLLLSLNYIPVMEELQALKSVQAIGSTVKFGWFFQTIHKQSVHLLAILSVISLVFSFRKDEISFISLAKWWSSVLTVFLVLFSVYSGNILVGDGYASQSFQIGGTIVKEIPLFGSMIHFVVFSPNQQELQTFSLIRMYVSHIVIFPILLAIFLFIQKPKNFLNTLKPLETTIILLTILLLQFTLAFVLPSNTKAMPYQPDWFFLPIHFLQYQVPSIITGFLLGGIVIIILLLPVVFRKNKNVL